MNLRLGAVHAGTLLDPAISSSPRERTRSATIAGEKAEQPEQNKSSQSSKKKKEKEGSEFSSRISGTLYHARRVINGNEGRKIPDATTFVRISLGCTELGVVQPDANGNFDLEVVTKAERISRGVLGRKKNATPAPQKATLEIFKRFVPYKDGEKIRDVVVDTIEKTVSFTDGGLKLGDLYTAYAYQPEDPADMNLPDPTQLFTFKELATFFGHNAAAISRLLAALGEVKLTEIWEGSTVKKYVDGFMKFLKLAKEDDKITKTPAMKVQDQFDHWAINKYPVIPHTEENLIKILESTTACLPRKEIDGKAVWDISWDGLNTDIKGSVADVKIIAQIDPSRKTAPVLEEIQFKFDGKIGDPGTQIWRSNGDSNVIGGFERASFVARSQATYLGQIREHLGKGHLTTEAFVEAIFRCLLDDNPAKIFLKQQLEGTEQINKVGAGFGGIIKPGEKPSKTLEERIGAVFGEGSTLEAGALTKESLNQAIRAAVDTYVKWNEYALPIPLHENDYFANAEIQYHKEISKTVAAYVKENAEVFLTDKVKKQFLNLSDDMEEYNNNIPRVYTEGMADEQYLKNIEDFTVYFHMLINHHSLRHATQYVLANVKNASLAIRNEALRKEGDEDVFAEDGNTEPQILAQVLFLLGFLMAAKMSTMFDPNYKIHPGVVEANSNLIKGSLKDMKERDLNHTDPEETRLKSVGI